MLPSRRRLAKQRRLRELRVARREFERLVASALGGIPEPFLSRLENVATVVEDYPSRELLRSLGIPPGETLLGLYEGIPLTQRAGYNLTVPDRITIFRMPILQMCRSAADVVEEVRRTVVHEVAHYYGIDDDELHRMGFS